MEQLEEFYTNDEKKMLSIGDLTLEQLIVYARVNCALTMPIFRNVDVSSVSVESVAGFVFEKSVIIGEMLRRSMTYAASNKHTEQIIRRSTDVVVGPGRLVLTQDGKTATKENFLGYYGADYSQPKEAVRANVLAGAEAVCQLYVPKSDAKGGFIATAPEQKGTPIFPVVPSEVGASLSKAFKESKTAADIPTNFAMPFFATSADPKQINKEIAAAGIYPSVYSKCDKSKLGSSVKFTAAVKSAPEVEKLTNGGIRETFSPCPPPKVVKGKFDADSLFRLLSSHNKARPNGFIHDFFYFGCVPRSILSALYNILDLLNLSHSLKVDGVVLNDNYMTSGWNELSLNIPVITLLGDVEYTKGAPPGMYKCPTKNLDQYKFLLPFSLASSFSVTSKNIVAYTPASSDFLANYKKMRDFTAGTFSYMKVRMELWCNTLLRPEFINAAIFASTLGSKGNVWYDSRVQKKNSETAIANYHDIVWRSINMVFNRTYFAFHRVPYYSLDTFVSLNIPQIVIKKGQPKFVVKELILAFDETEAADTNLSESILARIQESNSRAAAQLQLQHKVDPPVCSPDDILNVFDSVPPDISSPSAYENVSSDFVPYFKEEEFF